MTAERIVRVGTVENAKRRMSKPTPDAWAQSESPVSVPESSGSSAQLGESRGVVVAARTGRHQVEHGVQCHACRAGAPARRLDRPRRVSFVGGAAAGLEIGGTAWGGGDADAAPGRGRGIVLRRGAGGARARREAVGDGGERPQLTRPAECVPLPGTRYFQIRRSRGETLRGIDAARGTLSKRRGGALLERTNRSLQVVGGLLLGGL